MKDGLVDLVRSAERLVTQGYYDSRGDGEPGSSLAEALAGHPSFPIIAEVKIASPTVGTISSHRPEHLIDYYSSSGVAALSVLTEPKRFGGSMETLTMAAQRGIPVLMKDFIVAERQIDAASSAGASAVLLIQEVFDNIVPPGRRDELIDHAHRCGLEVLLEAGGELSLKRAMSSDAEMLGINQRDLGSFTVDVCKYTRLLPLVRSCERPVVVMSGIGCRSDVECMKEGGADAVLIGSALASSPDPAVLLKDMAVGR